MKLTYKIKPFQKNPDLDKLDKEKRQKVEEIIGQKLSDYSWIEYKKMVKGIKR